MKKPKKERRKERRHEYRHRNRILLIVAVLLFSVGGMLVWAASLRIPDLSGLSERKIAQSTKIYDRTGEILLYDMAQDVRRTIIGFDEISNYVKLATVAIEDKSFYSHSGVVPSAIIRASLINLGSLSFSQGGSTITQQVVKNAILTNDKTPTRKIKEWILAVKLDSALPKDEILNIYLNEIPYGGNVYGIEEASQNFYGKSAKELSLAESAYVAAMIKAPTRYSPYGTHRDELESRKNFVLREMLDNGFIEQEEYDLAIAEVVKFRPRQNTGGIKAPHFVFFVIDYLAEKYGEEALDKGGLKVVSTLDYSIQEAAEEIAFEFGESNEKNFNATNNAIVVIDPKTGDILSMVGSRDYFSTEIGGNFNVATSHRQPGSTFKPFVYSALFNKGFTPETILFDVPTQFSTACPPSSRSSEPPCYAPVNFDDKFRGPMTIREALAQSINIPAVKALHLAGIRDSLELASKMGITSLADERRYGLSLVLGGGEVSLLEMVSGYGVFANDGVRNPHRSVLRVEDMSGTVLEESEVVSTRILPAETARKISDILSDNVARIPAYGASSALYVPGRPVAVKTGTTNDFRDAWIIGYTPNVVVGAWAGNNDNSPMEKRVAGFIVAPIWRTLMNRILPELPVETFIQPEPTDPSLKAMLVGNWPGMQGRSELYWVDKNNPRGPAPSNPATDPQFNHWEYAVNQWSAANPYIPPVFPIFNPNQPLFPGETVAPFPVDPLAEPPPPVEWQNN